VSSFRVASARSLAHTLSVRVGPNDPNPFGLAEAADPKDCGVRSSDAVQRINLILKDVVPSLAFRHIPFNTIALEQYASVLDAALASHCSVGVGVDPLLLGLDALSGERHIVRVLKSLSDGVEFRDDSAAGQPGRVGWYQLERAVAEVGDGYWVIGDAVALDLPNCLPYRADIQ